MEKLELTPVENEVLRRSGDLEITRKRRRLVVISGSLFAAILFFGTLFSQRWQVPLAVGLLYIGMTVFEKIAYANAVMAYKTLIQKMQGRIEALEAGAPK